MRFINFRRGGLRGIAIDNDGTTRGCLSDHAAFPGALETLVRRGPRALAQAGEALVAMDPIVVAAHEMRPPIETPPKIICIGLNYVDHSLESGFEPPAYPTVFARFASSLIADQAPLLRSPLSSQLDYEGELAAVIGVGGRAIAQATALDHVIGYSVFNDGSVRDYQTLSPQWTVGKNFDGTGAFGPCLVTADALPPGCAGLRLQTRLNGAVVQDASISDMIFDVATLISILSQAITLEPGDVIVTGTPAGIGLARKPPLFMKHGDVCEVEIEGVGLLRNPVHDQVVLEAAA